MFPQTEIDGFRKYWRRRRPHSTTAVHYSSDVVIFFRWARERAPASITVHDVDRFIDWQHRLGRAPATITRRLIALRMFYDYLAYTGEQPLASPVIPHRHYVSRGAPLPRDLSEEVVQKLFAAIGTQARDRAMFTLMLHAGLRVGEVARLALAEIDLTGTRTPHLRLQGKGQRERIVYLSATAAKYLRQYLATRPGSRPERVFLNRRGQPLTVTGIQWQLSQYCRQAGVWLTCHQLRHTFASRLVAADVPVTSVQKLLGHRSLRTTQLYIHLADSQVEKDYRQGIQKVVEPTLARREGRR
jgi:site-specific recombinase XerD